MFKLVRKPTIVKSGSEHLTMEATKSDVHINIDIPETNMRGDLLGCMKMKPT